MNKVKRLIASILIILVFLCLFTPKSKANFFTDDWDELEETSEIEETIDNDEGGIFEKVIAKMIRRSS